MTSDEITLIDHPPVGRGLLGALGRGRQPIRVPDVSADPHSVGFPAGHPIMQSFLGVPIASGDRLLGQIYLTDKQGYHEFTEQDERVIQTLAAYAAIAITNARLYQDLLDRDAELMKRNEDLGLLNDVATALASTLEVDEILNKTLNLVMGYLGVEAGEIYLREDGEKELRLALHRSDVGEAFWTREQFRAGEGAIGKVAESGKPLVNLLMGEYVPYLRRAFLDSGFCCLALIPLIARANVVGVMGIATRHKRQIEERELNLLTAIGNWTAISVENARLHHQARRLAILEERERIGMDLHDGIIQSIYGVGLALDYTRLAIDEDPRQARAKIEQSIEALNSTIRDIRSYILDLRPRKFHGEDLRQGLQRLSEEFEANSNTRALLICPENGLVDFPDANATALFHICQEALANIARHANARQAELHLWAAMDRVLLEITDNGDGFDLSKMSVTLGHGLSNMHIRARKVGGDVEITSAPGEGTTVLAWVPRWAI